jgi:hypothetical protein
LGRYGFSNAVLTLSVLFGRILVPLATMAALLWAVSDNGPLRSPEILTTFYWIVVFYVLIRMLIARDITGSPTPLNFWLAPLFPFYMLFIVGLSQMYAEITELFRIGAKHAYVPDHIWEEIPWW